MKNYDKLVDELRKYPNETQWVEFKHNNYTPDMIGKDISALANSATLCEKSHAYMVWGIDDATHEIIGTDYNLQSLKKGNQEIESWLRALLSSNADFEFYSVPIENKIVGIIMIHRATSYPVSFEKVDYIRVGSYTKKLNDYPAIQSQLWDKIKNLKFEEQYAIHDLELDNVLKLISYTTYFDLTQRYQPTDPLKIAHYLLKENIIQKQDDGLYAITNLGAILFAKDLSNFPHLSRKAIRVVQYQDNSRLSILKEYTETRGYVVGFEIVMNFIGALLPSIEVIENAVREQKTEYPILAVREAVANALIHQDFSVTGAGPVIEIFDDRIEVTNPGTPLVDVNRIIDTPPRSRNEKLASLMRRLGLCEELGTGWDKIVMLCESKQLPAPQIELYTGSMRVILYASIPFSYLAYEDKLWACYMHACLKYAQRRQLTNASLRKRFGLKDSSSGSISRLLKDAVKKHIIKPFDKDTAPRYMKYVPFWA